MAGRIDYLHAGLPPVWSDSLLAPITLGREKNIYGPASSDLLGADDGDTSMSFSDSDMDADPEALRAPRGIVRRDNLQRVAPSSFADMLAAKPPDGRHRPQIDVLAALDGVIADCEVIRSAAADLVALLQSNDIIVAILDSEATQLRAIELCALSQRKERNLLESLLGAALGDTIPHQRLRRGNILRPVRSAAEGSQQAQRFQPLGHAMYLHATVSVTL